MFITPAYAQAAGAGAPDPFMQFLPFVLVLAIMYFFLIRPQQKRAKEHRAMLAALRRGDQVVTAGGLLGKVAHVAADGDEVDVEIAQGVKVKVIKATITTVLSKTEPAGDK